MESLADYLKLNNLLPEEPAAPSEREPLFELSIKDFCRGVLSSREYRQSVFDRVALGTLPPAVEIRMYDYAYGKPVDRIEHTGEGGAPIITEVRRVVVRAEDRQPETNDKSEDTVH